jgi:hypothetical protein
VPVAQTGEELGVRSEANASSRTSDIPLVAKSLSPLPPPSSRGLE